MTLLITGGSGQIGYELSQLLATNRVKSTSIYRQEKRFIQQLGNNDFIDFQKSTNNSIIPESLAETKFSLIFHLAAATMTNTSDPDIIIQNLKSTYEVLEFMRRTDSRCMVFSSSSAVYGEGCARPVKEDDELNPYWSPYSISKFMSEHLCRYYQNRYGLKIIVVRIFPVYGGIAEDQSRLIPSLFRKVLSEDHIVLSGEGRQIRDFIHVGDVCKALWLIYQKINDIPSFEVYNVSTSRGTSILELVQRIITVTGRKPRLEYDHKEVNDLGNIGVNWKIKNQLGFEPSIDLEQGLKDYYSQLLFQRG